MLQHLLLILVAAPLLVLGAPLVVFAWGLPMRWLRPAGQWWHRRKKLGRIISWISLPGWTGRWLETMEREENQQSEAIAGVKKLSRDESR